MRLKNAKENQDYVEEQSSSTHRKTESLSNDLKLKTVGLRVGKLKVEGSNPSGPTFFIFIILSRANMFMSEYKKHLQTA